MQRMWWRRGSQGHQAGFSLLEALLASAVLAGGVLLASQGFSLGARSAALARQYTQATLLAQGKLGELMLEEELDTAETGGAFEDPPIPEASWELVVEDTGTTGLVRLTVTVSWGGAWGERSLSLTALRPEFGRLARTVEAVSAGGR